LLEKIPEHKERAYLGRYLSKIDIPTEFLSDADIAEQYERVKNEKFFVSNSRNLNFSMTN